MLLFSIWEYAFPRNNNKLNIKRKVENFSLTFMYSLFKKLILPITIGAFYIEKSNADFGLLGFIFNGDSLLRCLVSIILFDLIIYAQHRAFHVIPFFWRFHKLHHSDLTYDFTTALRFHPLELLFSYGIKFLVILLLGISSRDFILFEIILSSVALFNHSNIILPKKTDLLVSRLLVTPDFHRGHHSVDKKFMNSNYGFNLSIWDRVFNSIDAVKFEESSDIEFGLENYKEELSLIEMIKFPFK
jgi:sterol desaturase/sphingolipid hydroxylase (fatty acid hydroxylase superfamily)